MKKTAIIFFAVLTGTVTGCAMRKDLMVLEGRMAQQEMQIKEADKEIARLNEQLETAMKKRDEAMNDTRGSYAGVRSQMDEIRQNLNILSGQIDELRHVLKQSGGSKLEDRFERLDRTITQNTDRIIRIENQLGIQAPKTVPGQTAEQPESGAEAEVPSKMPPMPVESAPPTEKGQYDEAKQTYDAGKWGAARQGFQKFLKTYPKSQYADSAQYWIAETFYQEKWYEKAILEYHEVIKNFPNGNKVPAAMFKQGMAFQQINDKQNAKLVWQELIRKFPKSNEATQAKQKMQ